MQDRQVQLQLSIHIQIQIYELYSLLDEASRCPRALIF